MNEQKTKVLYLVNIPSPYRVDFFNELGKHCELTVLFEKQTSKERNDSWHKNHFVNFKGIFLKGIKVRNNLTLCLGVTKYLNKKKYDIIVVGGYATPTGMLTIETLKLKKIPFILNIDGGIVKKDENWRFFLKKHFISSATYWLSTGEHTNKYLLKYGALKENIFLYPFTSLHRKDLLTIPINSNEKNKLKKELKIQEEKIVLSIGQFIPRKGFDTLLKAAEKIPEKYGIYIVGGEPPTEYIDLKTKMNLHNVHFIGFKSKEELIKFYKTSDLFVLPTREDIWGLVINEAMSFGLPVITTNKCVAGLELIEENKNGYIIQVNDSDMLGERINKILSNGTLHEQISLNNIKKIQAFTIEKMALKHIEIFKTIVNKGPKEHGY